MGDLYFELHSSSPHVFVHKIKVFFNVMKLCSSVKRVAFSMIYNLTCTNSNADH